jgi:hypothetical protein
MKKIITLMFCTALVTSVFAQPGHRNWDDSYSKRVYKNDNDKDERNDRKYDNNNTVYKNGRYNAYQKNRLIEKVNREYNFKIQQVNHDRSLSRREKKRIVKSLQAQRVYEIKRINAGYNNTVYNNRNNRNKNHTRNKQHNNYGY